MFGDNGALGSAGMALMIAGAALFALSLIHSFFSPATGAAFKVAGIICIAIGLLMALVIAPAVQKKNDNTAVNTPPSYAPPPTYASPPPPPPVVYSPGAGYLPPGGTQSGTGGVISGSTNFQGSGTWSANGSVGVAAGSSGGSLGVESGTQFVHLTVDGAVTSQNTPPASSSLAVASAAH